MDRAAHTRLGEQQLVDDDIDAPSSNGNEITREVIESHSVSSSSSAPDVSFRHLGFASHNKHHNLGRKL